VTLQLQANFFIMSDSPFLLRLQAQPAAVVQKPKRDRPLYGYNFSPPSTPNGNHTIAERIQMRKEARAFHMQEEDDIQMRKEARAFHMQEEDDIQMRKEARAFHMQEEEDKENTFTPRCLLERTIEEQKALVRSADMTSADWNLMASCLSPTCRKPPRHPSTHSMNENAKILSCDTCLCIACAGMKAMPLSTPCLVCGASIPYSVCVKRKGFSPPQPVPSMCFKCSTMFTSET
jgi:hypothetical protein